MIAGLDDYASDHPGLQVPRDEAGEAELAGTTGCTSTRLPDVQWKAHAFASHESAGAPSQSGMAMPADAASAKPCATMSREVQACAAATTLANAISSANAAPTKRRARRVRMFLIALGAYVTACSGT